MPRPTPARLPSDVLDPYRDQGRLLALQMSLASRIDDLLGELGVSLSKSRKLRVGPCPVHGGDNPSALNLYPEEGWDVPGYWVCNTRGCQQVFHKTVLGFVRGVMSHQQCGWQSLDDRRKQQAQKIFSWRDTVDWCCRFLGTDIRKVEVNYEDIEKRRFTSSVAQLTRGYNRPGQGVNRKEVRKWLDIPAVYFVNRGWSPEILDRYDVGLYPQQGKPLSDRVAVPVYDDDHRVVVGFTGRSVHPQCPYCKRHHNSLLICPDRANVDAWNKTAKWYNHGLNKDAHLYNFWFAKNSIRENGVVAVVEGPGDVWRLEEAGIHCSVGLFGVGLSDQQQVLLEISGAMDVVVLTDTDQAGEGAREEIKRRLGRSFRLHFPKLDRHDIGEMTLGHVKESIAPLIEKLRRR